MLGHLGGPWALLMNPAFALFRFLQPVCPILINAIVREPKQGRAQQGQAGHATWPRVILRGGLQVFPSGGAVQSAGGLPGSCIPAGRVAPSSRTTCALFVCQADVPGLGCDGRCAGRISRLPLVLLRFNPPAPVQECRTDGIVASRVPQPKGTPSHRGQRIVQRRTRWCRVQDLGTSPTNMARSSSSRSQGHFHFWAQDQTPLVRKGAPMLWGQSAARDGDCTSAFCTSHPASPYCPTHTPKPLHLRLRSSTKTEITGAAAYCR